MKMMNNLPPYITREKNVGQTPLEVLELFRAEASLPPTLPLAYAGRLDPMASGKLLILIGDTCKEQEKYHNLDKEYEFTVLLGISSDTGDVLGLLSEEKSFSPETPDEQSLGNLVTPILKELEGEIELPYPAYSSRTVAGVPLHTWAVTGRLDEITIPTKKSTIYDLELLTIEKKTRETLVTEALNKISLLPKVTDPRKSLGNDFRREEVLASWDHFLNTGNKEDQFFILNLKTICSSGTYMRTLAGLIGQKLESSGLAFAIHRTKIGKYNPETQTWDFEY